MFQHTAARRRLGHRRDSAHTRDRFNTQPPEGGWNITKISVSRMRGFNTQPPEGGWKKTIKNMLAIAVSTHSRPKAAGTFF